MALNSLSCADVPLSNYSLTHSPGDFDYLQPCALSTLDIPPRSAEDTALNIQLNTV